MESVYLETSFVSYLVALPSRDLVIAAHQRITFDWWTDRRGEFDCYISQFVIDEASLGDVNERGKRLEILKDLRVLKANEETERLAGLIAGSGVIPPKSVNDAFHIAIATTYEIDYVLTWNCAHLANAHILKKVRSICAANGYEIPSVCTPEELMEDSQYE